MTMIRSYKDTVGIWALVLGIGSGALTAWAGVEVLYSTGFEYQEGFNTTYDLPWQGGWLGDPDNGSPGTSGIISNTVAAPAQEAYVGFFPPDPLTNSISVWKPINHVPAQKPLVHFEVLMTINNSATAHWDNFQWRVRNINGQRLFTVDFDNFYTDVSYLLDDGTTNVTAQRFTNGVPFRFSLDMDFQMNQWSAAADGTPFITGQPITTAGASLTLGAVAAVWAIFDFNNPGDNFMTFDDYRITALPTGTDLAWIERLGSVGNTFALRLHGPDECLYAIETTTDLLTWIPLKTNVVFDGSVDFIDTTSGVSPQRFYRARFVP